MKLIIKLAFATSLLLSTSLVMAGETIYFVHTDHLAAPSAITDQTQNIVWQSSEDAFADGVPSVEQITFNIRFPGQYYDLETGLRNRYYDPSTGRYVTSDPIGLDGGFNTYGYVGGNPLIYTDPTGLIPPDWADENLHGNKGRVHTDESRRRAGQAGAKGFGEIAQYAAWVSAAAASKGNGACAVVAGQVSLGLGSLSWAIDKLNDLTTPSGGDGDNDNDGIHDTVDSDDDNDGVPDQNDLDPLVWDKP